MRSHRRTRTSKGRVDRCTALRSALTARGRPFDRLSLPHFAALGAGVGFIYFLFMGFMGAFGVWSLASAITNLVLVTVAGGGSATAILLVARRGRPQLKAGDDLQDPDDT